jgi:uncharacterized membrane protein YqjE
MAWFSPRSRGASSHPRARAQRLDVLIGILGFFTLMAFIQTVTYELQGRSAGPAALLLLALVVALWLAVRARRRTGV